MSQNFSTTQGFVKSIQPYLNWLLDWSKSLKQANLEDEIHARGGPNRLAIIIQDMTVAFCCEGPLASDRVKGIVDPIVDMLKMADSLGVENFVLLEDHHNPDALEFKSFGRHAVKGSLEAQTVPEIAKLPFAHKFELIPKNTLHPALGSDFKRWLDRHPEVSEFIVVGDCTDLCIYQTAMYLKLRANAQQLEHDIVVPENCVQTYDARVDVALPKGIMPHDANLLHPIFLSHMALNGIRVVKRVVRGSGASSDPGLRQIWEPGEQSKLA